MYFSKVPGSKDGLYEREDTGPVSIDIVITDGKIELYEEKIESKTLEFDKKIVTCRGVACNDKNQVSFPF